MELDDVPDDAEAKPEASVLTRRAAVAL